MKRFEYKQELTDPGDGIVKKMNEVGAEGWEYCFHLQLMMQSPLAAGPPQPKLLIVFKRELSTVLNS